MIGFLFALVLMLALCWWLERRANRIEPRDNDWYDNGGVFPASVAYVTTTEEEKVLDMACRNTPKGWRCTRARDHEGSCALTPNNAPLRFLRRNENGQLQRLVSDGQSAYWISAEKPSRYWYVWQSIAKARGI